MLSKNKLKYIKSLQLKKNRNESGKFLVEGAKSVLELLNSGFEIESLLVTSEFFNCYQQEINQSKIEPEQVALNELQQAGTFSSNSSALAIAIQKENQPFYPKSGEFMLMLDDVRDPGNLGTIIRSADWYGINKIICSEETAELYNPKVIASTMGSFTRAQIYYCNLKDYFLSDKSGVKVYGALLHGQNIHEVRFSNGGIILLGNESAGISEELLPFISQKITVPKYGFAESLNVAMACTVICDNIRRNN